MSIYAKFFKNHLPSLCILKLDTTRFISPILACDTTRVLPHITSAAAATPDIKAPPPPELLHLNNVWELDTIPTERPSDPGPISPGPNPGPDFPLPPNPSPPRPEGPKPPPHGPDVIPPKPPEPGPPHPIKPDVPPPIIVMGSDGLVFY